MLCEFQIAVVVTMTAVWMVQVGIHEVIDMVVVRYRFMAAIGAVNVSGLVTRGRCSAAVGVSAADFDNVLIDVIAVRVMQMPVVQVIDMPVVFHGRVAAAGAVVMIVIRMNFVLAHNRGLSPPSCARCGFTQALFSIAEAMSLGFFPLRSRAAAAKLGAREKSGQSSPGCRPARLGARFLQRARHATDEGVARSAFVSLESAAPDELGHAQPREIHRKSVRSLFGLSSSGQAGGNRTGAADGFAGPLVLFHAHASG